MGEVVAHKLFHEEEAKLQKVRWQNLHKIKSSRNLMY